MFVFMSSQEDYSMKTKCLMLHQVASLNTAEVLQKYSCAEVSASCQTADFTITY